MSKKHARMLPEILGYKYAEIYRDLWSIAEELETSGYLRHAKRLKSIVSDLLCLTERYQHKPKEVKP